MTEKPSPAPSATNISAAIVPLGDLHTKSCSTPHNMASKVAQVQRKLLSPSNASENCNPNINQGSCKRKVNSSPKPSSTDRSDVDNNAPKHSADHASADFNLVSPPRKQMCSSRRCASKNSDYVVPATVIPKTFLVSKDCGSPLPDAPTACKCSTLNNGGGNNHAGDDQIGSVNPCNVCFHDAHTRRWSSDDGDCKSLAGGGIMSPSLLASEPSGRNGLNASQSGQAIVDSLQTRTNAGLCIAAPETPQAESSIPVPKSWNSSSNELPNRSKSNSHSDNVQQHPECNGASDSTYTEECSLDEAPDSAHSIAEGGMAAEEGSPSPEKTGNWRLNAVLESFGSLTPLKEGRVKTLVRAFETLLSVSEKDKDEQEAGKKPRSYPLQFSYLNSDGNGDSDGGSKEDRRTMNNIQAEEMAGQQSQGQDTAFVFEAVEHTEWDATYARWKRHSTDGGGGKTDDAGDENLAQCRRGGLHEFSGVKNIGVNVKITKKTAGVCTRAGVWKDGTGPQKGSQSTEIYQNNEDQWQQQNVEEDEANLDILHGKQRLIKKSHGGSKQLISLQRFSMDGHSANAAARTQVSNRSHKPLPASRRGSNFSVSSARPPLAKKPQIQHLQEKLCPVKPQPFKLLTEERGYMKEQEFLARLNKLLEEEERLRVPLAQGLPWTTDEPEIPYKPPVKEVTKPLDIHLNSDLRAMERAEFDRYIAEKLLAIEERRLEEERLHKMAEEEEIKRMRKQEMVPKAQLMPYFDRPFRPRRFGFAFSLHANAEQYLCDYVVEQRLEVGIDLLELRRTHLYYVLELNCEGQGPI